LFLSLLTFFVAACFYCIQRELVHLPVFLQLVCSFLIVYLQWDHSFLDALPFYHVALFDLKWSFPAIPSNALDPLFFLIVMESHIITLHHTHFVGRIQTGNEGQTKEDVQTRKKSNDKEEVSHRNWH
jgi:hypothetical protein